MYDGKRVAQLPRMFQFPQYPLLIQINYIYDFKKTLLV